MLKGKILKILVIAVFLLIIGCLNFNSPVLAQNIVPSNQELQRINILNEQIRMACEKTDDLEAIGFSIMEEMGGLGNIGKPAIPAVIEKLKKPDENWKVRFFMAVILGEVLPDEQSVPSLLEIFQNEKEPELLRSECVIALGYIGDKEVVPTLIEALSEPSVNLRITVINVLGMLKDWSSVPSLILTIDDSDWRIQHVTARALGQIGDIRAIDPLAEKILGKNLPQENQDIVRIAAIKSLSFFSSEKGENLLMEVLNNEKVADVRIEAAIGLGKMKSKNAVDPLINALSDSDELLRKHAVEALVEIGDKKASPFIQQAIDKTKSEYVRKSLNRSAAKLSASE